MSSLTLLSQSMAEADEQHRRRQGFWLRMAREARGLDQAGVAVMVGLRTKAAISDYERGVTEVPQFRLRRFAEIYGWPLVLFTEPDPTAEELAQERIAQLARAAIRLAHQDEEQEPPPARGADGSRGEPRGRRSA